MRPGVDSKARSEVRLRTDVGTVPRMTVVPGLTCPAIPDRVDAIDWPGVEADLDSDGWARIPALLSPSESRAVASLYPDDAIFRSRVVMARHGFGRGEYKYFAYPLPGIVGQLRAAFYPRLRDIANRWSEALGHEAWFPENHDDFLVRGRAAGQTRPTPLLLQYGQGDYNCLHQDLYGQHVFPLQVAVLLAAPGVDFSGGEFVLTEQRPRMQSKVAVVPLTQGDAVIFAVHNRPVRGARGFYRVNMRHGVSRVKGGQRHTLGVIFHDAA